MAANAAGFACTKDNEKSPENSGPSEKRARDGNRTRLGLANPVKSRRNAHCLQRVYNRFGQQACQLCEAPVRAWSLQADYSSQHTRPSEKGFGKALLPNPLNYNSPVNNTRNTLRRILATKKP